MSALPETAAARPAPCSPGSPPLPAVRIAADLVCPWCWVGFTRLLRAAGDEPVHLVWEPFLLSPHLPVGGVPRGQYLERRFGSLTRARTEWRRSAAAAAGEGLELPFHDDGRQPCTLVAHAVILAAAARGRLVEAAAMLFDAALCHGRDIGAASVLGPITDRLELPLAEVVPLLPAVLAGHNDACLAGIDGVPMFRFGVDHGIAGAQPVEALAAMLALERQRLTPSAAG